MSPKCWYLCKYCKKAFCQSVLLIEHKRKMHGEELWKDCELKLFANISDAGLQSSGDRENQPSGGSSNFPSQGLKNGGRLPSDFTNNLNMDSHRHPETAGNSAGAIVNRTELNECRANNSFVSCSSEDEEMTVGSRGNSDVDTVVLPSCILETDKFIVETTTGPCELQQCQDPHSNSFICPIGISIFPSENILKDDLDSPRGSEIKKKTCSYCSAEFEHPHNKELHERKHKRCRSCRTIYDDPASLKQHECAVLSRVHVASNMEDTFAESSGPGAEPCQKSQLATADVILPECENKSARLDVPESENPSAKATLAESENMSVKKTVGRRRSYCRFCQRGFKGAFGLSVHMRKAHPLEVEAGTCVEDNQGESGPKTDNDSEKNSNLEQKQLYTQIDAQSSGNASKASECFQENYLPTAEPPSMNVKSISRPQIVSKFQLSSRCQPHSLKTVEDIKMIYSPGLSKDLRLQINCGILQYVCVLCDCISSHRTDAYAHLFRHKI